MAKIQRIAGSTKYLLDGMREMNGEEPSTLGEMKDLYKNYKDILYQKENSISDELNARVLELSDEESRLEPPLKGIEEQNTAEVDKFIGELKEKSGSEKKFLKRIGLKFQYLTSTLFRNYLIQSNLSKNNEYNDLSKKLKAARSEKEDILLNKTRKIRQYCDNLTKNYNFLAENQTFMIGAEGEEEVIETLSQLPDDYYVINDVNLHFSKAIHWNKENEYIKTCQIDHVVAGPTGLFLIETKNWKTSDIGLKSGKLKHQVDRSGLGLWYHLKDYYGKNKTPDIRKVIVSIHGHSGEKPDRYIDIIAPYQLRRYITGRDRTSSDDEIKELVKLIP